MDLVSLKTCSNGNPSPAETGAGGELLAVRLSVDYPGRSGVLRDATFTMRRGEVLGLAGESGSGKSTLALAILQLLRLKGGAACGHIRLEGRDLMTLPEREMRRVRGKRIALVPQSPLAALNPSLRIGTQLREAWRAHEPGAPTHLSTLLETVSLPGDEAFLRRHPRALSVGQAQRVLIAMALLHRPALVVADEPTSALDAITASEILALFGRLNRDFGMGILYISHDLLSMGALCGRVAILAGGEIVECGPVTRIFTAPEHSYTRRLIGALPQPVW